MDNKMMPMRKIIKIIVLDSLFQFNDSIKQTYTVENLLINAGYQINQLLQQSITIYVINQSKVIKTIPLQNHIDFFY